VADLAGAARVAAQHDAVDHDARADTRTDRHDEKILELAADAVEALGHRERVHIVLHEHRQRELAAQCGAERHLLPAQRRRVDDAVALAVHAAGHADADPEQPLVRSARDEPPQQVGEIGEERARRGVERLAGRALHAPVDPDLDEGHVVGDDLHADRPAGG
jgi:hypothetical protein